MPNDRCQMTKRATLGRCRVAALALCAVWAAGCLQIEARLKVLEDGTATLTERVRFSRRLLDLAGEGQPELLKLLSKQAALDRMQHMGKGIRLVRHELRDAVGASKESLAVFQIDDLNHFQYVSPWLAYLDYPANNVVKCRMVPLYKSRPYANGRAGSISVSFHHLAEPKREPKLPDDAPPPKGPSPLELQVYRELGPVFRDMLRGFQLRFTLEAFSPVLSGLGVRGRRAGATSIDLINVTDRDMDKWGGLFLGNEEIMLDLVRWQLGSDDVASHVREYATNLTLPVFTPLGSRHMWWTGGTNVSFPPSRPLFDKYFKGKKLDFSQWQPSPPEKHVAATWKLIGWEKR